MVLGIYPIFIPYKLPKFLKMLVKANSKLPILDILFIFSPKNILLLISSSPFLIYRGP